jgi:hypothetical protein
MRLPSNSFTNLSKCQATIGAVRLKLAIEHIFGHTRVRIGGWLVTTRCVRPCAERRTCCIKRTTRLRPM